jgi:hypothetical protein
VRRICHLNQIFKRPGSANGGEKPAEMKRPVTFLFLEVFLLLLEFVLRSTRGGTESARSMRSLVGGCCFLFTRPQLQATILPFNTRRGPIKPVLEINATRHHQLQQRLAAPLRGISGALGPYGQFTGWVVSLTIFDLDERSKERSRESKNERAMPGKVL